MVSAKTLGAMEYDKILKDLSNFATLNKTKENIISLLPAFELSTAEFLLKKTQEAYKLLYTHSISNIYYFDNVEEELARAEKNGVLTNLELLTVAGNLKSARICKNSFESVNDEEIVFLRELSDLLMLNLDLEKEIYDKIISQDEISDNASPKLYAIRKEIRNINSKIRNQLSSYIRGETSKYLQDSVITMRRDRYVIPVKSEYRSFVKGFIHDGSASGATVFIEPIEIIELNNQLKSALIDEQNEIHRILAELSLRVSLFADGIRYNSQNLQEIDLCFAKAQYAFYNKHTLPILNDVGKIDIKKGKHPLIDKEKVVPVNVKFGNAFNFILITGPNTGGKTVTLKLVGLCTLMASSGLYVPCDEESTISVFNGIYCDIGDEQSIEQSLSTFSSHIKNIINIINNIDDKSLVLLDEIGAGTDPEEGSALAMAIIEKLLSVNCFGIITTHYSKLKEFALESNKIENASMAFDVENLKPLYKLNMGVPGSSNAIDIAKTLGLDKFIIDKAYSHLSDEKITFDKVMKKAEESKKIADDLSIELDKLKKDRENELLEIRKEKDKIIKEREKIYLNSKQEVKRIVQEKLFEAEEIIAELKDILKRAGLESKEIFKAGKLKNRLENSKYLEPEVEVPDKLNKADDKDLKVGTKVFVKSYNTYAIIKSIKREKGEVEVLVGDIKFVAKLKDLFNAENPKNKNNSVKVTRPSSKIEATTEINVLGLDSFEALEEVKTFISASIMNGLEEIKIIHGVGEGILLKTIRDYLKKDKRIKEFRRGKYGEGENGVTIITLK